MLAAGCIAHTSYQPGWTADRIASRRSQRSDAAERERPPDPGTGPSMLPESNIQICMPGDIRGPIHFWRQNAFRVKLCFPGDRTGFRFAHDPTENWLQEIPAPRMLAARPSQTGQCLLGLNTQIDGNSLFPPRDASQRIVCKIFHKCESAQNRIPHYADLRTCRNTNIRTSIRFGHDGLAGVTKSKIPVHTLAVCFNILIS